MTTSKAHSRPESGEAGAATLGRAEQRATIVGSLLGGLAGAGVTALTVGPGTVNWLYLRYVALVLGIGPGSRTRGVVAFALLAAVFGAGFGAFMARYAAPLAGGLMTIARSTSLTRSVFGPFFKRAPLTTTTTLVGAIYGLFLGAVVGQVAVPHLVVGATPFTFELAPGASGILLGFIAYGTVLGLGYGASLENATPSADAGVGSGLDDARKALLVGPLVGGLAGGTTFYVFVRGHLAALALVVGVRPTPAAALVVWFLLAFLLALVFVGTAARAVSRGDGYAGRVTNLGLAYGVVLAVALGMVGVPALAPGIAAPRANLGTIFGYVIFGTFLGSAYGSVVEHGHVLPGIVREHRDAVVFSSLLGGVLGGGVVYQAAGHAQLLFYGALVGYAGSVPISWGVWLATCLLLGLFYVRFLRPRDTSAGYLWRSARRGTIFGLAAGLFVGATVVPSVVRATTRFAVPVPNLDPLLLLGYALFGAVVGTGYGASVEEEGLAVDADRTKGVLFGSMLGGLLGGLVIHHLSGPLHIQLVGAFVGVEGSIAKSWAVWLLLSVVFGLGFARIVSESVDAYVDSLSQATANNPDLRAMLKPALEQAALTTTTAGMGVVYGAALGVVVGLLVVPMLVTLVTQFRVPYPSTDLAVLLGYTVYGLFLGTGYGVVVEF